jgi:hypothetical protein
MHRKFVNCPTYTLCADWARYQKNISVFVFDISADFLYATGDYIGKDFKPMVCSLVDGVIIPYSLTMLMFHRDSLMKRVNEIIDRVVEAGLYNL